MLIDITLPITPQMLEDAKKNQNKALEGHLGTHFDVMDKEFPLEYTKRTGVIFDVSKICNRDIEISDIDIEKVKPEMFVVFYSGYIEETDYCAPGYFKNHPQLSVSLIEALAERKISIIGLDFGGVRRTPEHIPMDQYLADRNIFVVENICDLGKILKKTEYFTVNTYPLKCLGITGLPCRVICEI